MTTSCGGTRTVGCEPSTRGRLHVRVVLALVVVQALALVAAPTASARQTRWGVTATFVPVWQPVQTLYELLYDVNSVDGDGYEFRVGVARGRHLGGDWSVVFVRSAIRQGTQFDELEPIGGDLGGPLAGEYYVAKDDLRIDGIKFDGFWPFVTIRDRVQIGLVYGAGVGWLRGTVEEHSVSVDLDFPPPDFEPVVVGTSETIRDINVADEAEYTTIPLGNVEAAVAFILTPGFKIRVSGGFNFPNTHVIAITGVFLFGG